MGVRRPEPNHKCVLWARWVHLVLPAPVSPTLRHTLLRPTTPATATLGPPGSRLGCERSPVVLLLYKQRPDDRRHLVRERDGYQHARFASQHLFEPRFLWRAAFARLLLDGAAADDQEAPERALAHFGCRAKLLFATGRSLEGREAQPGGKVGSCLSLNFGAKENRLLLRQRRRQSPKLRRRRDCQDGRILNPSQPKS